MTKIILGEFYHIFNPARILKGEAFQFQNPFSMIKQRGKLTSEDVRNISMEYALTPDQLGTPVKLLDGSIDTSFAGKRLKLRYTDYSEDINHFFRVVFSQSEDILSTYAKKLRSALVSAQLFFYIDGRYSEEHSLRESVVVNGSQYAVEFNLKIKLPAMTQIRFDPAEEPIIFKLRNAIVADLDGDSRDIKVIYSNAEAMKDGKYVFSHNDPILIFDSSEVDFDKADHIELYGYIEKIQSDS
jgi:hypothetical protein